MLYFYLQETAVKAPSIPIFSFSPSPSVGVDTEIHTRMCIYRNIYIGTVFVTRVYTHTYFNCNKFLKSCEEHLSNFHVFYFLILRFRSDTLDSLRRYAGRFPLSSKGSFYWSFLATMLPKTHYLTCPERWNKCHYTFP